MGCAAARPDSRRPVEATFIWSADILSRCRKTADGGLVPFPVLPDHHRRSARRQIDTVPALSSAPERYEGVEAIRPRRVLPPPCLCSSFSSLHSADSGQAAVEAPRSELVLVYSLHSAVGYSWAPFHRLPRSRTCRTWSAARRRTRSSGQYWRSYVMLGTFDPFSVEQGIEPSCVHLTNLCSLFDTVRKCPGPDAPLYPLDQHPSTWPSCHDAYEVTWAADVGNHLVGLSGTFSLVHAIHKQNVGGRRMYMVDLTSFVMSTVPSSFRCRAFEAVSVNGLLPTSTLPARHGRKL